MKSEDTKTGQAASPASPPAGRAKRAAAFVCIGLLAVLYLSTLIVAFLDFPGADRLFQACLVATVGLPILLWIYLWLFEQVRKQLLRQPQKQSQEQSQPQPQKQSQKQPQKQPQKNRTDSAAVEVNAEREEKEQI